MSIKQILKKGLKQSAAGEVFFFYIRILREKISMMKSDKDFLEGVYKKRYGADLNWTNPKTYGEVGAWLKLFYRDERMIRCADKYGIRDYRGGGRSSGRETLARVAAGAVAKKVLKERYNIDIVAFFW